jgi:hypothetical protein
VKVKMNSGKKRRKEKRGKSSIEREKPGCLLVKNLET